MLQFSDRCKKKLKSFQSTSHLTLTACRGSGTLTYKTLVTDQKQTKTIQIKCWIISALVYYTRWTEDLQIKASNLLIYQFPSPVKYTTLIGWIQKQWWSIQENGEKKSTYHINSMSRKESRGQISAQPADWCIVFVCLLAFWLPDISFLTLKR